MTTSKPQASKAERGWNAIRAKLVSDMERKEVLLQRRVDQGYNNSVYSMDGVRAKLELRLVKAQLAEQLKDVDQAQRNGMDPLLWKLGQ